MNGLEIAEIVGVGMLSGSCGIGLARPLIGCLQSIFKRVSGPQPGDRMPDGTIYAGISPNTDKPMYTTAADEPLTYELDEAKSRAAALEAHGHNDWHIPSKEEWAVLFENRNKGALRGTFNFNEIGSFAGSYWSSTMAPSEIPGTSPNPNIVWQQRLGYQEWAMWYYPGALRCVR